MSVNLTPKNLLCFLPLLVLKWMYILLFSNFSLKCQIVVDSDNDEHYNICEKLPVTNQTNNTLSIQREVLPCQNCAESSCEIWLVHTCIQY